MTALLLIFQIPTSMDERDLGWVHIGAALDSGAARKIESCIECPNKGRTVAGRESYHTCNLSDGDIISNIKEGCESSPPWCKLPVLSDSEGLL